MERLVSFSRARTVCRASTPHSSIRQFLKIFCVSEALVFELLGELRDDLALEGLLRVVAEERNCRKLHPYCAIFRRA